VSQECTEQQFKEFFAQFGRVIDATLMMDKDTGRPRGFGFVTFDGDDAVDRTLQASLAIHGKPIEVKRAEPRGGLHEEKGGNKFNRRDRFNQQNGQAGQFDNGNDQAQFQGGNGGGAQAGAQGGQGGNSAMSQAQMAQYWFKMQEYFRGMQAMMAQNMAQQQQGQNQMPMMPQGMNPAMMQQMMAMNQQRMMSPGGTPMGPGGPMSPASNMQQMQQMQQMQNQMMGQGQTQQQQGYGDASPGDTAMGRSLSGNRPAFNAQEQMVFEQQKYERQQAARMQQQQYAAQHGTYAQGGPTSWEGMYDDVPQPNMPPAGPSGRGSNYSGSGRAVRGAGGQKSQSPAAGAQPSNAPANAPTGPKNHGRPGANYRGGRGGGRGGGRAHGFQPY
jgi:RNA-binding protein Musashi